MPSSELNIDEKARGGYSPGAGRAEPTKAETIVKLLKGKRGASLEDLKQATGWQGHSVRGLLSGTVKKRMGLAIESETDKAGVRRYGIAGDTPSAEV
jgi:Protein of unknown function (DUF3489)